MIRVPIMKELDTEAGLCEDVGRKDAIQSIFSRGLRKNGYLPVSQTSCHQHSERSMLCGFSYGL